MIRGMQRVDLAYAHLASSEIARHINRDVILEIIRANQPISRAELARLSGLQRSTVSLIVNQLIQERWVRDGGTTRLSAWTPFNYGWVERASGDAGGRHTAKASNGGDRRPE